MAATKIVAAKGWLFKVLVPFPVWE